jgi:hydrogenase maturation protein HypF
MDDFPLCPDCLSEFKDPLDRRFHHQTICCPKCGPKYRLEDNEGPLDVEDPILSLAKELDAGRIAVVKGWGGMHICCNLDNLKKMREWYGRKEKPFAIMARDMDALKNYGEPTPFEEELLRSPNRPIVLVKKKESDVTELASPGLDNIGMFLPYTGMHHILFSNLDHDALVMTSANIPGEPMIVDDKRIKELGADLYLLHNQPILNRADDTVVRAIGSNTQFIRRSRGNVPYHLPIGSKGCAIGLGPQENLTAAVSLDGYIWPTQYIGNGEKIGVPEYLEEAVRTQIRFLNCRPTVIALDLHPGYSNRPLGKMLSQEYGADLIEVQHHWAHAASLMVDSGVESCVALTLDGTGHGDDGTAWGGEVLQSDFSSYKRVAHLETLPLLGSEKALYDLRRLKFAIDEMNGVENHSFTDSESMVLRKLMKTSVRTSSFGRVLDALSYWLGVCEQRTYDGEPAMKLEPLLARGKLVEGFETETVNGCVKTAQLFHESKEKREDVAYSIVYNIMKELVQSASESADSSGMENIGITGGVSYNGTITNMFMELVEKTDHQFILHNDVPNGDGGVSIGQVAIAARKL